MKKDSKNQKISFRRIISNNIFMLRQIQQAAPFLIAALLVYQKAAALELAGLKDKFDTYENGTDTIMTREFDPDGVLAECGTHEELMQVNGKYAYMFRLQSEKYVRSSS